MECVDILEHRESVPFRELCDGGNKKRPKPNKYEPCCLTTAARIKMVLYFCYFFFFNNLLREKKEEKRAKVDTLSLRKRHKKACQQGTLGQLALAGY